MNLDDFSKVCKDIKSFTKEIYLHIIGDPLVLSNLDEYIQIAQNNNLTVNITTSGFFVDKSKFHTLISENIKQINFSLNSFNANNSKLTLKHYLAPLFELASYKLNNGNKQFINYRLWNIDNINDKAFNIQVFDAINDYFNTQIDIEDIYKNKPSKIRVADKVLINFDDYFEWPSLENEFISDTGFCYGLDSHIGVLSNGKVVPCCLDKNADIELGNILNNNLSQILVNKKTTNIINGFKEKKVVEELCQKCSFRKRFD